MCPVLNQSILESLRQKRKGQSDILIPRFLAKVSLMLSCKYLLEIKNAKLLNVFISYSKYIYLYILDIYYIDVYIHTDTMKSISLMISFIKLKFLGKLRGNSTLTLFLLFFVISLSISFDKPPSIMEKASFAELF